jgi:hypothetical protein
MLWILGLIGLLAFNRLFMPSLNPYGRPPIIAELLGYFAGASAGFSDAIRAQELMKRKTKAEADAICEYLTRPCKGEV